MNPAIYQWAMRNGVSEKALHELRGIFGLDQPNILPSNAPQASEAFVQSVVRLEAVAKGLRLWRNNVGALPDARGVPVRYGLANDSPQLNRTVKSGDLIGWRPVLITPGHVGSIVAQFVSRECKRPGWRYSGDDHERAQQRWNELVNSCGGDAAFCTGQGTL